MQKTYGSVLRSGLETPQTQCVKESITVHDVWSRLDELDATIQSVYDEVGDLNVKLNGVLRVEEDSIHPVPGPRAYSSPLESRVCAQADLVDDISRRLRDIRNRLTV